MSAITDPAQIATFDPKDEEWSKNLHVFKPKLSDPADPNSIVRRFLHLVMIWKMEFWEECEYWNCRSRSKNGEITTFNIINAAIPFHLLTRSFQTELSC